MSAFTSPGNDTVDRQKNAFYQTLSIYAHAERAEQGNVYSPEVLTKLLSEAPEFVARLDISAEKKVAITNYIDPRPNHPARVFESSNDLHNSANLKKINYTPPTPTQIDNNRRAIEAAQLAIPSIKVMASKQLADTARDLRAAGVFDVVFQNNYFGGYLENSATARAIAIEHGQPNVDFKTDDYRSARELAIQLGHQDVVTLPASYPRPAVKADKAAPV